MDLQKEGRSQGTDNTRNYSCAYHGMVEEDDIFGSDLLLSFKWISEYTGDIDVLNIHEYAVLNQTINKQFTPGS